MPVKHIAPFSSERSSSTTGYDIELTPDSLGLACKTGVGHAHAAIMTLYQSYLCHYI